MEFFLKNVDNSNHLFNHLIKVINHSVALLPDNMTTTITTQQFNNAIPYIIDEDKIKIHDDFESLKSSFGIAAASFIIINRVLEAVSSYLNTIDDEKIEKALPIFKNAVLNHFFIVHESYQPNTLLKKILYDDHWLELTRKEYNDLLVLLSFGTQPFTFRFEDVEQIETINSFNPVEYRLKKFNFPKPTDIKFDTPAVSKNKISERQKMIEFFLTLDHFRIGEDDNRYLKHDLVSSYIATMKNYSDKEINDLKAEYINFHEGHIQKERGRYFSLSEAVILISYCYFKNHLKNNKYFSALCDEKLIFKSLDLTGKYNIDSIDKKSFNEDYDTFLKKLNLFFTEKLVLGTSKELQDKNNTATPDLSDITYSKVIKNSGSDIAYFIKYVLYEFYNIFYYTEFDALQCTFSKIIQHISVDHQYYSNHIHLDSELFDDNNEKIKPLNLLKLNKSLQEWYKNYYKQEIDNPTLYSENLSGKTYNHSDLKNLLEPSSNSFSSLVSFHASIYLHYPQRLYRKKI